MQTFRVAGWFALTLLAGVFPAVAAPADTQSEIENLKQRIQALETRGARPTISDPPFSLLAGGKYLKFSGLSEIEASYSKTRGEAARSDLTLATAQLAAEVTVNENIGGHLILLYEEEPGENFLQLDEAVITLRCSRKLLGQVPTLSAGRLYLPFGRFNSFMVSDPLTVELSETRNTAAVVGLDGKSWSLEGGLFNGEVDSGHDTLDSYVVALKVTPAEWVSFGAGYLSDLAESDAALVADANRYHANVAAASIFGSLTLGPIRLEAELVAALDDFDPALIGLDANGDGAPDTSLTGRRPRAWALELGWCPDEGLQLAGRFEGARDFQGNPTRYGGTVSYELFPHTIVALEYLRQDPRQAADSDTVTAQLALAY